MISINIKKCYHYIQKQPMLKEANGAKKTSVLREYRDRFQIDFVVAVRAMEIVEYRALIVNSDKSKKCSLDFCIIWIEIWLDKYHILTSHQFILLIVD